MKDSGDLYIVSTPIGNLDDITLRALETLKKVDLIAAEDTRRTGKLLRKFAIEKNVVSYHSHSGRSREADLVERIKGGQDAALVSDSGTPGISDPGSMLVRECVGRGIRVIPVPGASAFLAALVASGFDTSRFQFEGFLSSKKGRRRKQLERLKDSGRTVVLYESPHRILSFLDDFNEVMGERELVLAREPTKVYEEIKRGTAACLREHFLENKPRGEFVVIF
jgi:16S rRNA (cytidine1402-2'-O)-methyltransferase